MEKNDKQIRTNLFSILLISFSLIFLLVYLISIDGIHEISAVLRQADALWMLAAVGCMVLYWILDAFALHLAIKPVHPSQRFRVSFHFAMIGQYFNNVTPFASGGQPAQGYFLVKRGVPLGETVTALMTKFIVYQVTMTLYSLVMLILRFSFFMNEVKGLMIAVIVGFIGHAVTTAALISVAVFKSGTFRAANLLIDVLVKLKIVKNPEAKREFVGRELETFHSQFGFMSRHKGYLLKIALITVAQLTVNFLIGNAIYHSFRLSGAGMLTMLASQSFVTMIATFVPIPGAVGAAEGSFAVFFSLFFPNNLISMAVVIWRLITFYLPIVAGLAFTLLEKRKCPAVPLEEIPVVDELAAHGGQPVFAEEQIPGDN